MTQRRGRPPKVEMSDTYADVNVRGAVVRLDWGTGARSIDDIIYALDRLKSAFEGSDN